MSTFSQRRVILSVTGAALILAVAGGCAGRASRQSGSPLDGDDAPRPAGQTEASGVKTQPSTLGAYVPGATAASVVESSEPWAFAGATGKMIRTKHYRVFTTVRDAVVVQRAPLFLEVAIGHYRTALGDLPAPPIRLDTFLMANRPQWTRLTLELLGREGERYTSIPRGGFATGGRAFLWDIGVFDTLAIAAHEGWHQYTQRTFLEGLPIYLEEGIATYMEGHRWLGASPTFQPWANVERFDQLRSAVGKKEIRPLRELLSSAPQDLLMRTGDAALNYYAQVWAFTHFLDEGAGGRHAAAFRRLVRDAAEGRLTATLTASIGPQRAAEAVGRRRGPEVIEVYFGDLDTLAGEYTAFIDRLTRAGSRQAIVAGRSPLEASPGGSR